MGLRLASSFLCAAVAVGCGGGSKSTPGGAAPATAVVGKSGGAVSSMDGNVGVTIPAGALGTDVMITVAPAEAPASGAVGTVYEIGPTGTQFAMPVALKLHYDPAGLDGMPETSLRVATFAAGTWQLLPGAVVDTAAKTVSGLTMHLSPYAIVSASAGQTCAQIQGAPQCAPVATAGGAGGPSTGGGTDPGSSGAPSGSKVDGSAAMCTVPTCASASNACAAYPGAALDGCTDSANGYAAACCFPSGGPICFAISGAGAPCATAGGTGGNTGGAQQGGTSCPAPPTCATAATACAAFPGAKLQNCVDGTTGYTGACCFDPGSPVCISTGAARGCAAGGSCPPPPRCADANPCAAFAGATVQSCTDTSDGYQAACCFPLGTLPGPQGGSSTAKPGTTDGGTPNGTGTGLASGTGSGLASGTGGGSGGTVDAGTGGVPSKDGGATVPPDGGGVDPGACQPGGSCQAAGAGCVNASPTSCQMCTCSAAGTFVCTPCPDKSDAGAPPPPGGGAGGSDGTCQPGAPCQAAGAGCLDASPTSCQMCTCGAAGTFVCTPCPDKSDAGVPPPPDGTGTGGGICQPGAPCQAAGAGCLDASPTSCQMCMCSAAGTYVCTPCPDKSDAGAPPPPPPADAGTTCQTMTMPWGGAGTPCGAVESCPDGQYAVKCDGTTGQCTCLKNGSPAGQVSLSCADFTVQTAFANCKFPTGM